MVAPKPNSDPSSASTRAAALTARTRCRSFCFLEHEGEPWTAFLVTYAERDGYCRGHFMFRSGHTPDNGEIRTADLFVETSEEAIDARARSLGRPLLQSLLQSAVHTAQQRRGVTNTYAKWFRDLLARSAQQHAEDAATDPTRAMQRMKSLYESYRTDQVCHLIALTDPNDFRALVEKLLDGREIDFRARDRFQLAMIVVQELEKHLPLPPFEKWLEDYVSNTSIYEEYSRQLHTGELP